MAMTGRKDVSAYENIVLLQAETVEEAFDKADEIGRSGEGDSNSTLEWDGTPARMVYRGTRRLVSISSPTGVEDNPTDGCEVTYLQLKLDNEEALDRFMEGDSHARLIE
jgi:hypothetical protein